MFGSNSSVFPPLTLTLGFALWVLKTSFAQSPQQIVCPVTDRASGPMFLQCEDRTWKHTIRSASMIVESRWATMTVVLLARDCARELWILRSVMVSSELVASSNSSIPGFFSSALANATRCFSPPLSRRPRSPA